MANGFIGQVHIGSDDYLLGSTLFGICNTKDINESGGSNTKQVALQSNAYFNETTGITIHVKFTYANTETSSENLKLQILSGSGTYTTARPIRNYNGPITWNANSIINFTFDGTSYIINSSAIDGSSIQDLSLGNITNNGALQPADVTIAAGDKLVITDASDNDKIARASLAFSAPIESQSQSTTFLRADGTWAAPSYTTDTHYEASLITGPAATTKTNTAGGTNSVYLNLVENNTVRNAHHIVGASGVTVASDANGEITITGSGGTVTSVQVQATSPVVSSVSTASNTTLSTTISLADGYGDTKNPYAAKNPHYVLAGPSSGSTNAAPTFRALVAADLPTGSTSAQGIVQLSAAADDATKAATAKSVYDLSTTVNNLLASADALVYKGTLTGAASSTNGGAYTPAASKGDVYKVLSAGYINGVYAEAGDMFICNTDSTAAATSSTYSSVQEKWDVIQTNLTNAVISDGGEAGYLAKFKGPNTIEKGPQISSTGTGFLKEDGTWGTPEGTYSLPLAANGTRGGIQIGYSESGTNYAVKLSSEKAYVTVPWTDTKVTQALDSASTGTFPLLFSDYGTSDSSASITSSAKRNNNVYIKPSAGELHATKFVGNGSGLTNVTASSVAWANVTDRTADAGSDPGLVKTTSTVSDTTGYTASPIVGGVVYYKDTNTHYSTSIVAGGSTATSHAAVSSGNVYLRVFDDSTHSGTDIQLHAGSNMTITSSAQGVITFASTYSYNLSAATSGALGGIKIGYSGSDGYAVALDGNDKAYVAIPTASTSLGLVKTTSTESSATGYTAAPIIDGVVYYQKYKSTGSANALTSLTLSYNNGTAQTESVTSSSSTAIAVGTVQSGVLYIKSVYYGTTSVSTGVSVDNT